MAGAIGRRSRLEDIKLPDVGSGSKPVVLWSSTRFPEHWRLRAEEARTVADQMTQEAARTIMRRIALDYDRLAKLAEGQLADQERGAIGDKT